MFALVLTRGGRNTKPSPAPTANVACRSVNTTPPPGDPRTRTRRRLPHGCDLDV